MNKSLLIDQKIATTRDLHDLAEKKVLHLESERKSTRYFLMIKTAKLKTVTLNDIL